MLTDELKQQIQGAYSQYLQSSGRNARPGQKLMIAEIARAIAAVKEDDSGRRIEGESTCLIEAPTGTGKTVAYILATLPMALAKAKTLVISTATINLQEQIVYRDLPDILKHSGLEFSYTLAKGRARYLCVSKLKTLQSLLQESSQQTALDFILAGDSSIEADDKIIYKQLEQSFDQDEWDGDFDQWREPIAGKTWRRITANHYDCSGRRCPHIEDCPYFKSRKLIEDSDCVVVNHDLVLADLALGGGVVLPSPEQSIYVFDEAHHLPEKAIDHFSLSFRMQNSIQWIQQLEQQLTQLRNVFNDYSIIEREFKNLTSVLEQIASELPMMTDGLSGFSNQAKNTISANEAIFRFVHGVVPAGLATGASNLAAIFLRLCSGLSAIEEELKESLESNSVDLKSECETWYPIVAQHLSRAQVAQALWNAFAEGKDETQAISAKWINYLKFDHQTEIEINCSPIISADLLEASLWQRAYVAVLTSATLAPGGGFDRFVMQSGVSATCTKKIVPSAFNYRQLAVLNVPNIICDPTDEYSHTSIVVDFVERVLDREEGNLVIFTSRKQMQEVYGALTLNGKEVVLMQGDYSRQEILARHCDKIDGGQGSTIFGLASFSEGVDLPGRYLSHVVLTRIPFAVPDEPVLAAMNEWLESQGRNPFFEVSIPDATLKLIQICGRLIRKEDDCGQITLLDRRIITKRYGGKMLKSLPPYRLNLGYQIPGEFELTD